MTRYTLYYRLQKNEGPISKELKIGITDEPATNILNSKLLQTAIEYLQVQLEG